MTGIDVAIENFLYPLSGDFDHKFYFELLPGNKVLVGSIDIGLAPETSTSQSPNQLYQLSS